jgi:uncharacterized RDD family membrane protein YckC
MIGRFLFGGIVVDEEGQAVFWQGMCLMYLTMYQISENADDSRELPASMLVFDGV